MVIDKSVRVLVVDDNQGMRKTVRILLEQAGLEDIHEARDGVDALGELKEGGYDILVSDWNMPRMDGLSLVRMIRSDAALKDLLVIMVTAEAERDNVIDAIKIGIDDYIVKPFTADVLQKKVAACLSRRAQRGQSPAQP